MNWKLNDGNSRMTEILIDDFLDRTHKRLGEAPPSGSAIPAGDHLLNPGSFDQRHLEAAKPAAVLIPLVIREHATHVLLTERAADLRTHSGQVAFPGGRIDTGESAEEAALRETFEEIGLARKHVAPLAHLPPYLSGTGYLIHPVIGIITPDQPLLLNPHEVSETFEVPLAFLMDPANHQLLTRIWNGRERYFYAMPYEERYIWGVTAGIIRALYERLYL
jgi:8-oxo-dGTP pyrophosphatase MutT (NUDIX family)